VWLRKAWRGYLHHDQQGSTRLITSSTGKVEWKCSYSPYGTPTCEGTATTPLGYDGQYSSSDTGLIYLRSRVTASWVTGVLVGLFFVVAGIVSLLNR
jgi:uncharacterized protein RhaS with RHS repeats